MAYCEEADVRLVLNTKRVSEGGDHDRDGSAESGLLALCIARAGGHIGGIIRRRYKTSMPSDFSAVSDVPEELRYNAAELAAFFVLESNMQGDRSVYDRVTAWAQSVRDGLGDLSEGTMTALATGPTSGRARFYREKGTRHRDVGEPEEGDVDADTDNSFMTD